MANNAQTYRVEAAIGPAIRDRSPDSPMRRSGCCKGFLCLGSVKRGKRIVPATRVQDGNNSSARLWGVSSQLGPANQYSSLSPSLLAPPSSPASFQNSAVQSSVQSPAAYSAALPVQSATSQIPLGNGATMFQVGPYAHETALVSPPAFSTFTTAPSTAPFTPPPELATAHLTTPSSPDVPFAQLLASSLGTKASVRVQSPPTHPALPFASPDVFPSDDLQAAYQLYPGSPLAHLISPPSVTGESTPFPDFESAARCPFTDADYSLLGVAKVIFPGSTRIVPEPATCTGIGVESLLSRTLTFSAFQESGQEQQRPSTPISSGDPCGTDSSGSKLVGSGDLEIGSHLIDDVTKGSKVSSKSNRGGLFGNPKVENCKASMNQDGTCMQVHERDSGLFTSDLRHSPVQEHKNNCSLSDEANRNLIEAMICNLDYSLALKMSTFEGNGLPECSDAFVHSDMFTRKFSSSVLDSSDDGAVGGGAFATGSKVPLFGIHKASLVEAGRTEWRPLLMEAAAGTQLH